MNLITLIGVCLAVSVGAAVLTWHLIKWDMGAYPTYDFRLHEDDTQ